MEPEKTITDLIRERDTILEALNVPQDEVAIAPTVTQEIDTKIEDMKSAEQEKAMRYHMYFINKIIEDRKK